MMNKLQEFKIKIEKAATHDLVDSLIAHAKKAEESNIMKRLK